MWLHTLHCGSLWLYALPSGYRAASLFTVRLHTLQEHRTTALPVSGLRLPTIDAQSVVVGFSGPSQAANKAAQQLPDGAWEELECLTL